LEGPQPLFGFRTVRRVACFHGADHGDHVVPDGGAQCAESRRRNLFAGGHDRAIDQGFQRYVVDPRGVAFARQVEASAARLAGVTGSGLQNAQAEFDAVVCGQAFGDQRR
jgi:hypothetical protein